MPDLRQSPQSPQPAAVGVDRLRALSARDAGLVHGCTLLDIRPHPHAFLPGSAWLPVEAAEAVEGELPSHMLPRPGGHLIVCSDDARRALDCARQLCARGWTADYLDDALPVELLHEDAEPGAAWRPDPYVEESMAQLMPLLSAGDAVDFGCGNGRNLVYLAQLGLKVLGVDHLSEALRLANHRARHHHTSIETLEADLLRETTLPARRFAIAFCVRFTRLAFLERVESWLNPDGLLLFHGYGLHPEKPHPRTMRRAIRLSLPRVHELFPPQRWSFVREPLIHEESGECWISFVARRKAS